MIQTINFSQFCDGFPESYKHNFSYDGKRALFDYLENYENDTGETVEFDPIALCCDYREYDTWEDFHTEYPHIKDFEELSERTTVIEVDNAMKTDNFIIQSF
jgi:hypothetical protein